MTQVSRALISVYDKSGLVPFVRRLHEQGIEIVSSGGTAAALEDAGIPVTAVAAVTGAPEMLGGRVKTLHPRIHAGILANMDHAAHRADLEEHGIDPFQLVVVNLYPFEATVAAPDVTHDEAIEKIDIGGPSMIRAAAKNHDHVAVVTSPDQYDTVAGAVEAGGVDAGLRRDLARAAFFHTAAYDAAIVGWLEDGDTLPARAVLPLEQISGLRYGENPHQNAAIYAERGSQGWWTRTSQLQGKSMSFNNYGDTEAAWRHVSAFDRPACVIVKHANACGAAIADSLVEAFSAAWDCDPVSAFGSVIAINRPLDRMTADRIAGAGFVEIVIAPEVVDAGPLAAKENLRLLVAPPPDPDDHDWRRMDGGFLLQQRDSLLEQPQSLEVVSNRKPTPAELSDMTFAWTVAGHTKSNAIVVASEGAAVGVGAGDQSRIGAARRALAQAGGRAAGAVAASDAFFPFRDGLDVLAEAGITAVIQPGGSKGDEGVIEAANEHDMSMVFTHRRHFLH